MHFLISLQTLTVWIMTTLLPVVRLQARWVTFFFFFVEPMIMLINRTLGFFAHWVAKPQFNFRWSIELMLWIIRDRLSRLAEALYEHRGLRSKLGRSVTSPQPDTSQIWNNKLTSTYILILHHSKTTVTHAQLNMQRLWEVSKVISTVSIQLP